MIASEIRKSLENDDKGLLLDVPRTGILTISPIGGHRVVASVPLTPEEYLTDKIASKCWKEDKVKLAKAILMKHGKLPKLMWYHIIEKHRGDPNWRSKSQHKK